MNTLLQLIHSISPQELSALGAWMAIGGGNSIALQVIKHFKGIDSPAVARSLLVVLSTIGGFMIFILSSPQLAVIPSVAKYTTTLIAVAHFWYWLTVSPTYKWLVRLLTDAENYRTMSAPLPTSVAEQPPAQFGS